MYKNILLPLDGSKIGEEKIPTAIKLAKTLGARIIAAQIIEVIPVLKKDKKSELAILRQNAEEYLEQITSEIKEAGVSTKLVIMEGNPADEISAYAEQEDVDLVIISSRGLGRLGRWALGSVSDKVLRYCSKPILLYRSGTRNLLRGKTILAVDDEPDVLEMLEELLDMCVVHKATSSETALEYLRKYKYDIALLDIMGVNGFDLLKKTVAMGIPTVMISAHAVSPDALRKSMKEGAVFYLPKDKLLEIEDLLVVVIKRGGKSIWEKSIGRFAPYFRRRFGWSPEDEENFMKEIKEALS